ncbi:hypothetical protein [Microbacterium stercoris]|uniref:Uncharacterized protein n=1 Tax=Microbacterium stercoris TaxID=2820289 RepID=A0A939QIQ0_9MICO|nr:hypothetical protein [Microbacterium stercoris]MBO3663637.1 hypothetical protein [Microbacterium stercoris]
MENEIALIESLEPLEAPGWVEWVVGIGAGAVATGGLIYGSVALGVAIT